MNAPSASFVNHLTLPRLPAVAGARLAQRAARPACAWTVWHRASVALSGLVTVAAALWSYSNHAILDFGDGSSHMAIARRVTDNLHTGLAQLGGVWLPLPHLLLLPFVQNDFLWRSGLAGTLVSVPCTVGAALCCGDLCRLLTGKPWSVLIGAALFVANPNVLYLATTPMTEPVLWLTMTAASWALVRWTQQTTPDKRALWLVSAAALTCLATTARYDGWGLWGMALVIVAGLEWRRTYDWRIARGATVVFGVLASFGIFLWLAWNQLIFGTPFYFARGPFSSYAQSITTSKTFLYHRLDRDVVIFLVTAAQDIGPGLLIIGLFTLGVLAVRGRSPAAIAALSLLAPLLFDAASMWTGDVPITDPVYGPAGLFNMRFGTELQAAMAVGVTVTLVTLWQSRATTALIATAILALWQIGLTWTGGAITYQDASRVTCATALQALARDYHGGLVGINSYDTDPRLALTGLDFKQTINETDADLWTAELRSPNIATWLVISPQDGFVSAGDMPVIQREFHLVATQPGATLWLRNGAPLGTPRMVTAQSNPDLFAGC